MKKNVLLFFVCMMLSLAVNAEPHTYYCELLCFPKLNEGYKVYIDFGEREPTTLLGMNAECRPVDDRGQVISFISLMAAVNYMADRGWKVEQKIVNPEHNETIFVMSKQTEKYKIKEGIRLKGDTE